MRGKVHAATLAHVEGPPLDRLDELIWVGDIPALGARRCPDRAAVIFADRDRRMTYAELDRSSNAFVAMLREFGLNDGDRVAYLGRNSELYLPVLFGAIRAGVVVVPLNWRLTATEIGYQLADSRSRLLLHDARPDRRGGKGSCARRRIDNPVTGRIGLGRLFERRGCSGRRRSSGAARPGQACCCSSTPAARPAVPRACWFRSTRCRCRDTQS